MTTGMDQTSEILTIAVFYLPCHRNNYKTIWLKGLKGVIMNHIRVKILLQNDITVSSRARQGCEGASYNYVTPYSNGLGGSEE